MTHYEYPDNFYRERASSVLAKYANAIATFLAPNSHQSNNLGYHRGSQIDRCKYRSMSVEQNNKNETDRQKRCVRDVPFFEGIRNFR